MITRTRIETILKLALPITIGLGSAFIMVMVDIAMVGTLGNAAVAALGISVFTYSLIVAFVAGFKPAIQGIVARRRGEESTDPKCLPLNGGLLLALVIGAPLSLLCYFFVPFFFSITSSDPEVTKEGIPYLKALFTAIIAVGMNSAFAGYWNGMAKTKVYMLIILFSNSLNIFLNYVLIFGNFGAPALGTMGAGIASAVSVYVGSLTYFIVTFCYFRAEGFLSVKPESVLIIRIIKIGLPATFQSATFSLGFIVYFWMVGIVGTAELAVANVLSRFSLVLLLFAQALGVASATLVSNTLGKGDPSGAAEWGWDVGKLGVIWVTLLGFPLVLFPEGFISIFLSDPDTISMAIIPTQLTGALTGVGSLIWIFATTLLSLGDGKRVLMVSFTTQWIFFLPAVWIVGPYLSYGLLEIALVQGAYGLMAAGLITALWSDGRWKRIKI